MPDKREQMRRNARRELAKRGITPKSEEKEADTAAPPKKPPSFFSGFFMILAGSFTFSIFTSLGQPVVGVLAGLGFIIVGTSRISRATSARSRKEKLKN